MANVMGKTNMIKQFSFLLVIDPNLLFLLIIPSSINFFLVDAILERLVHTVSAVLPFLFFQANLRKILPSSKSSYIHNSILFMSAKVRVYLHRWCL